jgi:hypothetical protein
MSQITTRLPCAKHLHCAFHRDHARKSTTTRDLPEKKPHSKDTTNVSSKIRSPDQDLEGQKSTPYIPAIHRLPVEVFMLVVANLYLYDRLALSLTCRSLFSLLEKYVHLARDDFRKSKELMGWRVDREGRAEAMLYGNEFLRILARDLEYKYWHCGECVVLHSRCVRVSEPATSSAKVPELLSRIGLRQQSKEDRTFRIRLGQIPLYEVTYPTAQAVMDRHTGKATGLCIDSLRCSGAYSFPCMQMPQQDNMVLRYEFEPKIVLDRLLLKATYTWEVDEQKDEPFGRVHLGTLAYGGLREGPPMKETGLCICGHVTVAQALAAAANRELSGEYLRCRYCPTEYWMDTSIKRTKATGETETVKTKLYVWHNLGPCQARNELRWTHLTSRKGTKAEYSWSKWSGRLWDGWQKSTFADEDVGLAYERIKYATRQALEEAFLA